jgi:diguanylate cyclase (GGDEF)-like protein
VTEGRRATALLAAGLVTLAAYLATPGARAGASIALVMSAATAVALCLAARRAPEATQQGWRRLAWAVTFFTAGDTLWYWYDFVRLVERPAASLADVFHLLGYPLLTAGVVALLGARSARRGLDGFFDGSIIALGMSVVAWESLIEPTLEHSGPIAEHVVAAAYPVMDVVLLIAVASLALTEARSQTWFRVLLLGLSFQLVGDAGLAATRVSGVDVSASWFDSAWLLSYVFLAVAAYHPSLWRPEPPDPEAATSLGAVRAGVLSLALLAPPVALVFEGNGMDPLDGPVVLTIFSIVVLLVLARLWGLLAGKDREVAQRAYQAVHDPLTGLPNRVLFHDRLEHALLRSRRSGERVAVMFLDVDHFKLINDSAGHDAGDHILLTVAERFSSAVRASDTVARFGGDEFTVLCEGVTDEAAAAVVARRLQEALAPPIPLNGQNVHLSTSIGIAVGGGRDDERDSAELMRDADTAMYQAKERGRARHEIFDADMRERTMSRLATEDALRTALEDDQLRLVFQPEISLDTGALTFVEALIRWAHPERGMVAPAEFLPVAEESGLIVPIGRWVLRQACQQAKRWYDEMGEASPTVAVNLSGRQLARSDLAADVAGALLETGLPPGKLAVEVTESVVLVDAARARATLETLKELGVTVAMDDFGTGYSSLSHLRELPVDVVKIDRSFVGGVTTSESDAALVAAVIGMAQALGLVVVAEGVETAEEAAWLREKGCDIGQGYWFARPVPAADVLAAVLLASARD